ncbi:restriction endonuclease subunit S [Ureaplasma diversum]|uniref:restriction endonuclease subunit S n=1 Tax=Ureaplasma diversum TaxID=42094 RepID=UPI001AD831DD|nr:restriction endonuclease subunit S [Ureaplasma diversum]
MSFGKPYISKIYGCIHNGWLLIRSKDNRINSFLLCYLLSTQQMFKQYKSLAVGSLVNNLTIDIASNIEIYTPNESEQQQIGELFKNLDQLIQSNQNKLDKLKDIKNGLLDKMFPTIKMIFQI